MNYHDSQQADAAYIRVEDDFSHLQRNQEEYGAAIEQQLKS